MGAHARTCDLVVVGASAGGVAALTQLMAALPGDLRAALCVVLHSAPTGRYLAPILDQAGPLHADYAADGEPIRRGRVYLAPPDRHLIVRHDHLHLTRTPKENWTRPAINPLFRSAASAFGSRVAGVVLTGMLDNGTAGLLAVEAAGGVTVVQDPADAPFPGMPASALDYLDADHVVPLAALAGLLVSLSPAGTEVDRARPGDPITGTAPVTEYEGQAQSAGMTEPTSDPHEPAGEGVPTGFTCPECNCSLWSVDMHGFREYVCRIGHRFSPETLLDAQGRVRGDQLESSLRSLREEAALVEQMLRRGRERGLDPEHLHRHVHHLKELKETGDALERLIRERALIDGDPA